MNTAWPGERINISCPRRPNGAKKSLSNRYAKYLLANKNNFNN